MTDPMNEALHALFDAEASYKEACQEVDTANRRKTACLNKLNEARKYFDTVIEAIRARTGRDSDWWNERREKKIAR